MEIPRTVYHGTFWPSEGIAISDRLSGDVGYVSTSASRDWAWFFAWNRRYFHKRESGRLVLYEINTELLPEDVINGSIPPDGMDPRVATKEWLRASEEDMLQERIKISEWRFPYIPLNAVIAKTERLLEANPRMTPFDVAIVHPRG